MKLYRLDIFHNAGRIRTWHSSQAGISRAILAFADERSITPRYVVRDIETVEIPTTRAALAAWLTDNFK